MGRSHLCTSCGHDLSRLRAPPDPHYRLPVVVCPGCATACVRRPYAGTAGWRSFLRGAKSFRAIAIRVLLIAGLGLAVVASSLTISLALGDVLRGRPLTELLDLDPRGRERFARWLASGAPMTIPLLVASSIASGAACALAFPHWPVRRIPLGVVCVFAAVLMLPHLLYTPVEWAAGGRPLVHVVAENAPTLRELALFLGPFGTAIALQTVTALLFRQAANSRPRGLGSRRLRRARRRRRQQP